MNPIVKAILQLGLGAAATVYFIYWVTTGVSGQLKDVSAKLDTHMNATITIQQSMQQSLAKQDQTLMKQDEQIWILRQMCVNMSKPGVAQDRCFTVTSH